MPKQRDAGRCKVSGGAVEARRGVVAPKGTVSADGSSRDRIKVCWHLSALVRAKKSGTAEEYFVLFRLFAFRIAELMGQRVFLLPRFAAEREKIRRQ